MLALLVSLCSLYAYQYYMKPEISISSIEAECVEFAAADTLTRIHFSFGFKNVGKSKIVQPRLYTLFLNWGGGSSSLEGSFLDFTVSETFELAAGQPGDFEVDKVIPTDDFVRLVNAADGLWFVAVCECKSDNLVFWGRTFHNSELLFLKPGLAEGRMKFAIKLIKQRYSTDWFSKERPDPVIFELIAPLSVEELIFGDRVPKW